MAESIITEIIRARPHDSWLQMKLTELSAQYQSLLKEHLRLVRDNSKLRTNNNRLRAGLDEIPAGPTKQEKNIFSPGSHCGD